MSKNESIEKEHDSDLLVTAATPVVTPAQPPEVVGDDSDVGKSTVDPEAGGEPAPYEVSVTCPNCSTVWEGSDIRPHANWFCTCDYPLFWVLPPTGNEVSETGRALSRLPGTDGRETLTSLACPHCGERNPPIPSGDCLRCGLPLTIGPQAPPPEPVVVTVEAPAPPAITPRRIWPWVVAACVFASAFVITLIILINE